MKEVKHCQSCGMPMTEPQHFGTNENQTPNEDYCVYCYKDGTFMQDCTMDEMIAHCAEFVGEFKAASGQKMTKEEAVAQMKIYFPKLKRWAEREGK